MNRALLHLPPAERLAATMADLCRREGLSGAETDAVVSEALAWPPGLPRDPAPLLRQFTFPT